MSVQTFEAITDDNGNLRFTGTVRLPAHTKVYIIVPEQTTSFAEIVPEHSDVTLSNLQFPFVRVVDNELAKRLVKTVIEDCHAEL